MGLYSYMVVPIRDSKKTVVRAQLMFVKKFFLKLLKSHSAIYSYE